MGPGGGGAGTATVTGAETAGGEGSLVMEEAPKEPEGGGAGGDGGAGAGAGAGAGGSGGGFFSPLGASVPSASPPPSMNFNNQLSPLAVPADQDAPTRAPVSYGAPTPPATYGANGGQSDVGGSAPPPEMYGAPAGILANNTWDKTVEVSRVLVKGGSQGGWWCRRDRMRRG